MKERSKTSGVSRQGLAASERTRPAPGGSSSFPCCGRHATEEAHKQGSLSYLVASIQAAKRDPMHKSSRP